MEKVLHFDNLKTIYHDLAIVLDEYKESEPGSYLFIVEGTQESPIVGIRYPGKKVRKRTLKKPNKNSALWANLYDFEVVPFEDGKPVSGALFTFQGMLEDYNTHKKNSKEFWGNIERVYNNNAIEKNLPTLGGIDPHLYLLMLKWIWIEEDLNYKLSWDDIDAPTRYRLETRTGTATRKGAGRDKFYAALLLLRGGFEPGLIKKIITLY